MLSSNRARVAPRALALAVAGALALGATAVGLTTPAAAEDEFALVLDHGHIDAFTMVHEDDQLRLRLREDVTGHHVLHEAADVLLQVKEQAELTLPSPVPARWSFLGKAGDTVYLLPQTQDQELIWPGWSTERLNSADFTNPMRLHITEVNGPGRAFLWQTGAFGDSQPVLESGSYRLPGDIAVNVNAHVHANWAFTRPGRYTLTVHAGGTRTSGTEAVSDPVTYTFDVGDPGADPDPDPEEPEPEDPDPEDPKPEDPDPEKPEPEKPGAIWNVANGTVNKQGATVLNNGHVDVASLLGKSKLTTKIKDTTKSSTPVWRNPAKTILQLLPSSRTKVPAGAAYAFLGKSGTSFYQVSQVQQAGLLWPGWSTESIEESATTGGVLWSLTDVSGPGSFALYETDPFGQPKVLFNSRDGINAQDRFTIPKKTHAHGSWAFSKQGNYCLSMQRVAQTSAGETVADQFVLAIAVGRADVMRVNPKQCDKKVKTDPPTPKPPPKDPPKNGGGNDDDTGTSKTVPQTECTTRATILSAGHIDYATRIVGGKLQSQIGDDTSGSKIYREPAETIMWLKPSSKVTLPSGYGQVGGPGTVVWQVPQTQNSTLIWLGWNTESLNAGNVKGSVTWRLDQVQGPGTVKVYLSGPFGGVQQLVLAGAGSSYTIPLGVHAHANWAFSKQGIYRLRMTQSATLTNGTRSSDTETMTIAVGDVDPASAARSGADCKASTGTETTSTDEDETTPKAAPQSVAPPATASGTGSGITAGGEVAATTMVASTDGDESVPLLVGALGGLFLLGSAGTGALWWRGGRAMLP